MGRSVFLNNRNRDLLVICGHWTSRFACSLWALGRSVFVNNRNWDLLVDLLGVCGYWAPRFSFWFYRFLNNKNRTEPNRNQSVWTGFSFKILKLIMSVWFIFLCKNRTEPNRKWSPLAFDKHKRLQNPRSVDRFLKSNYP